MSGFIVFFLYICILLGASGVIAMIARAITSPPPRGKKL